MLLPPGQQLAAPGKWPIVGQRTPLPWSPPWRVSVVGAVEHEQRFTLEELQALPHTEMVVDIHCVTRWSKLGVRFRGVSLKDVLNLVQPKSKANFVSFVAHSEGDHSTSLPLMDAVTAGAILAWEADGTSLPEDRGGPLRIVTPGRYFYKSVKWLKRIELLTEDQLGTWEAEAGYHNEADPWKEQRYIASTISKQQAAKLIETRDFSSQDLMGIDVSNRELSRLQAKGARLRNADFEKTALQQADFQNANLSNAKFQDADLRLAKFTGADLEGANFCGADIRGATFEAVSLFGATFIENDHAAKIDQKTQFDEESLHGLAPIQREFIEGAQ